MKPTIQQRQLIKVRILEAVSGYLANRVDDVFLMADEDDKSLPRINWRDLQEVREQICGAIADDLHHGLGDYVQEILESDLIGNNEAGLTPSDVQGDAEESCN